MKLIKYLFLIFLISSCNSPYKKGEQIYSIHCANCHGENGQGLRKLYPPITEELYEKYKENIACMVRYGINDTLNYNGTLYTAAMPSNDILTDIDIVNIVNFLDWKYGSTKTYNGLQDVKMKLANCK